MKAAQTIARTGEYRVRVVNPDAQGSPFAMQIYRNRTRLAATDSLYEVVWRGVLVTNDLVEAGGERDVTLTVEPVTDHAQTPDQGNEPAPPALPA